MPETKASNRRNGESQVALIADQYRHRSALDWAAPRPPKWLDAFEKTPELDDSEDKLTDQERRAFCEQVRRLRESLQQSDPNRQRS